MPYSGEQGVRIGPAPHGLGVFSLRSFRERELIGPVRGTVMEDPQYESDHCMEMGDRSALEPAPPFRYLNHSCHPNCALVELEVARPDGTRRGAEMWLEALCAIAPGEQLTIDYHWPAEHAIPCACGCPDCRGWIVAREERNRDELGRAWRQAGAAG